MLNKYVRKSVLGLTDSPTPLGSVPTLEDDGGTLPVSPLSTTGGALKGGEPTVFVRYNLKK
jgi:hypothetical protein